MGKVKRDCKTATNICPQQCHAFVAAPTHLCFTCHGLGSVLINLPYSYRNLTLFISEIHGEKSYCSRSHNGSRSREFWTNPEHRTRFPILTAKYVLGLIKNFVWDWSFYVTLSNFSNRFRSDFKICLKLQQLNQSHFNVKDAAK